MEFVHACPIHGREKKAGRVVSLIFPSGKDGIYSDVGTTTAWYCNICNKYYVDIENMKHKELDILGPEKRIVSNVNKIPKLPHEIIVVGQFTSTFRDKESFKSYRKIIDNDGKIKMINFKYSKKEDKVYIDRRTQNLNRNFFEQQNVKIMSRQQDLENQRKKINAQMKKDNLDCIENNSKKEETVEKVQVPETKNKEKNIKNKKISIDNLKIVKKVATAYKDAKIDYNPYQFLPWTYMYNEGVDKLLISDEVGLGKTIEAGIIIEEELENYPDANILVICPAFLRYKWKEELKEKFYKNSVIFGEKAGEELRNITILPLSRMRQFDVSTCNFDLIVVDEIHYFKNDKSSRYSYIKNIIDLNSNSKLVFMSATPLNNTDNDYHSIARLFNGNHYTTSTTKKQAYIKLAKRNIEDIYVDLTIQEQELYDTTNSLDPFSGTIYRHIGSSCLYALTKYAIRESSQSSETKNELSDSIMQLFEGEEFKQGDLSDFYDALNRLDIPKHDSKIAALIELINMVNDKKIILFTHYIETVKYLQDALGTMFNCAYIYANNTSKNINKLNKNRFHDAKEWFESQDQNEKTILICSDSCKEGIDLQTASCLINYDLPFNPSILEQRIGRIDRKGQVHDMKIYNFHVNNTYDDRLHYILQTKLRLIHYYAEFGIGNPLRISSEDDSTIDKFIQYFKKSTVLKMSNEDYSVIKKMLRECKISCPKDCVQKEMLSLLEDNKTTIGEYFENDQLDMLTDEQLEIQYKQLNDKLGFPNHKKGILVLNDKDKEFVLEKAKSGSINRQKVSALIEDYDLKLQKVIDTGLPMIITTEDIKDEHIFSSDVQNIEDFLSDEIVEELIKEGADIEWI